MWVFFFGENMIKAVCFDLDGVFFTDQSFTKFKCNVKEFTNHTPLIDDVFHGTMMSDFKTNNITEETFWDYVRETLQVTLTNEEFYRMLRKSYSVNHDIKNFACEIKEAGYKTCLCSNNFVTRIRELEKEFSFLKLFDVKVFSYDIGVLKPNINIFHALVEQCGVDASEIVYADDSESKLTGAEELGINTFIFADINQFNYHLASLEVCTED